MKECANSRCSNETTDRYCSYTCKEASDHAAMRNRERIIRGGRR